jgi:hypothetical protein
VTVVLAVIVFTLLVAATTAATGKSDNWADSAL